MPDLTAAFAELRQILAPYAARLDVKRDTERELYVDTWHLQPNRKPLFFGAVQVRASSVRYHLMPVYVAPSLLASVSPELRARLQGLSCFAFRSVEPGLRDELARLTAAGYESYRQQGFVA